jgi:hypothetical protein
VSANLSQHVYFIGQHKEVNQVKIKLTYISNSFDLGIKGMGSGGLFSSGLLKLNYKTSGLEIVRTHRTPYLQLLINLASGSL